jgi:hypothetical protein
MYRINVIRYNIIHYIYCSVHIEYELSRHTRNVSTTRRITVSLEAQAYERLAKRGHYGETFSQIVARLLDELDASNGGDTRC